MAERCTCKTCGSTFSRNRFSKRSADYCSLNCIQRYPCLLCGKVITGRVTNQSGAERFCSRRCGTVYNKTLTGSLNYVVRGFTATIRRTGKLACETCGDEDQDGLTVHHVDRNRRNNASENLKTLCGKCHAIEHWRGSRKRAKDVALARFLASIDAAKLGEF